MIIWEWIASSVLTPSPDDHLLIFSRDGNVSGELPGARHAVLRHRAEAAARDLHSEQLGAPEWIEAEGCRGLVVDIGKPAGLDVDDALRLATHQGLQACLRRRKSARVVILVDRLPPERLHLVLEGAWLGAYLFDAWKSKPTDAVPRVVLAGSADSAVFVRSRLEGAAADLLATDFVRDLVNEPGSALTPQEFIDRLRKPCKEVGVRMRVIEGSDLEKESCNGLITVGKGSHNPPALVVLEYRPRDAVPGHLVLVGKGITFDTGGISIKPGEHMWEMKSDKAGAAACAGAVLACARTGVRTTVSAVLCLAENRPGNPSVLPGDIFHARNGKTVMVENTDAEGRLVLSDGLVEAGRLHATSIVDVATLTGSVVKALGGSVAGLFSNDDHLANRIVCCGRSAGEKYWRLPLEEEYRERLKDPHADMRNTGGTDAGSITAALFLREFVPEGVAWAHLDIAGTAFPTKPWKYFGEGATAFGVRTLVGLARDLVGRT